MYSTLTEALAGLKNEGYTEDLNIAFDHLKCAQNSECLYPGDFEIDQVFRFEEDTDPSEQSALYAVSSKNGAIKGVLVNGYGIYATDVSDDLLRRLQVHKSA